MKRIIWFTLLLLLMSGCSYNPSDEDIVDTHDQITNLDKFMTFIKNVNDRKEDKIRVVRYTIEGDPMLHDLDYDGEIITSTTDTTRDEYGKGSVITADCTSIDVIETIEGTEYNLSGCNKTNRDNSILVIRK
jgi:PBP1b-binding outer membrane lipoprotein LpoB